MNSAEISSSLSLRADGLSLSKDSGIKIRVKRDLTDSGVLCSTDNDMPVELASQRTSEPGEEEMLDSLVEAEEVRRLMADFEDVVAYLQRTKILPSLYRAGLPERSSNHDLLCLTLGTTSMILRRDGDKGGIHFIEVDENKGPRSYGHTQTAITKSREFLEQFRRAINAS